MNPRETYGSRLAERRVEKDRIERRADRLADARLLTAVIGAVTLWAVVGGPKIPAQLLGVPLVAFVVLVAIHARTLNRRDRLTRACVWYERALARFTDEWPGTGSAGDRYSDPDHPYETDLDVFGRGSLFERMSSARTRAGEDTLASWLLAAEAPDVIEARQAAALDLRDRLDLREEIALLGEEVPPEMDSGSLAAWATSPVVLSSRAIPWLAGGLGLAGVVGLVLWLGTPVGGLPLAAVVLVDAAVMAAFRGRVGRVLTAADHSASELDLLAGVLGRFESETFRAPHLLEQRRRLETEGDPPSLRVRGLVRLCQLVDAARNQLFMPIAILLLWNLQCAFALERWRRASGRSVGQWLAAVGEIEALLSIARYAYERTGDPFPEIARDGPVFRGKGLAHPLLGADRAVRNDLSLGGDLRLVVVSGSNMSGKSTLLRTVGANAVLALMGAPVTAESLCISPMALGASLRVVDSLLEGRSRFYAEITGLKQVVDLTEGDRPVLFLLDELLHGTNSKDRAAGAEAIVGGLVERGAVGLVTTHDLALSAIADDLGERAENRHFEDRMEDGEMVFDYRLREGVVTRSNALALMRAVGLDV